MTLLLSASALTDRVWLHSGVAAAVAADGPTHVMTASAGSPDSRDEWKRYAPGATVVPLWPTSSTPYAPESLLRVALNAAFDRAFPLPSRSAVLPAGSGAARFASRAGIEIGRSPALTLGLERATRSVVGFSSAIRLGSGVADLTSGHPAMICTNPFWGPEWRLLAAATRQDERPMCVVSVSSIDNLTTKGRMLVRADRYFVWSNWMRDDLLERVRDIEPADVVVVGAPQFSPLLCDEWRVDRSEYLARWGLDDGRPVLLYALGSPRFIDELPMVRVLAERVESGHFGDTQLLVRAHPLHRTDELERAVRLAEGVAVDAGRPRSAFESRSTVLATGVRNWVSALHACDAVLSLASTMALDAAICDRPILNLDFDVAGRSTVGELINAINSGWPHYRPFHDSGALCNVQSMRELEVAVRESIVDSRARQAERGRLVSDVAGGDPRDAVESFREAVRRL